MHLNPCLFVSIMDGLSEGVRLIWLKAVGAVFSSISGELAKNWWFKSDNSTEEDIFSPGNGFLSADNGPNTPTEPIPHFIWWTDVRGLSTVSASLVQLVISALFGILLMAVLYIVFASFRKLFNHLKTFCVTVRESYLSLTMRGPRGVGRGKLRL